MMRNFKWNDKNNWSALGTELRKQKVYGQEYTKYKQSKDKV